MVSEADQSSHASEERKCEEGPLTEKVLGESEERLRAIATNIPGVVYRVTPFADSAAACEVFGQAPREYDLVITDLTMPKLTGVELAGKFKAIRSDIPIILCSGFVQRTVEEAANKTGISAVLRKPVKTAEIADMVRRLLDVP